MWLTAEEEADFKFLLQCIPPDPNIEVALAGLRTSLLVAFVNLPFSWFWHYLRKSKKK